MAATMQDKDTMGKTITTHGDTSNFSRANESPTAGPFPNYGRRPSRKARTENEKYLIHMMDYGNRAERRTAKKAWLKFDREFNRLQKMVKLVNQGVVNEQNKGSEENN